MSLSKNTKIINESKKWSEIYGSSLSSSRFVSGNLDKISVIESKLSEFTGKEKSLIFSGGFLMNSTLIPTLTGNTLGQRNKVEIFVERHFKYSKVYYLKKIFSLILITIYTISFNLDY